VILRVAGSFDETLQLDSAPAATMLTMSAAISSSTSVTPRA
jgi:hypothetical protein